MNIDTILANNLNGEPLHDAIVISIIGLVIYALYKELFKAVFSIFK